MSLFDFTQFIEIARKNTYAASRTQQLAMTQMHEYTRAQASLLSGLVKNQTVIASDMIGHDGPEDKIERHADTFRDICETSLKSIQDMTASAETSTQAAFKLIHGRMHGTISEIQDMLSSAANDKKTA